MNSMASAPPAAPAPSGGNVQHGTRAQLPKKPRPIDFYRQLPFCKLKEKEAWEYVVSGPSGRNARPRRPLCFLWG